MAENIVELLTDVADAIREKKGSNEPINAQNFADEIRSIEGGGSAPRYTGHADVEGLKAIGWDDDDIAYYQEHGVNWNEEDDEYHKVSDDNKALYGVLNASNYKSYSSRIVYMPKIDGIDSGSMAFNNFQVLVALPLKLQGSTTFFYCFNGCKSLACCPPLDLSQSTAFTEMFTGTSSIQFVPKLTLPKATALDSMFNSSAYMGAVTIDAPNATSVGNLFRNCYAISSISLRVKSAPFNNTAFNGCCTLRALRINAEDVTFTGTPFINCVSLEHCYIQGLASSVSISNSSLLSNGSILYIIENASAIGITITLHASAYDRAMANEEIVAAMESKQVNLAKA